MTTENMTQRRMLELAAKAAGIELEWFEATAKGGMDAAIHQGEYWNPLTDDGDALRLAMKLRISIIILPGGTCVIAAGDHKSTSASVDFDGDPFVAARRAIVSAAAKVWEIMSIAGSAIDRAKEMP